MLPSIAGPSLVVRHALASPPAIAAYERYAENNRKRLIMLRKGGRVIRRATPIASETILARSP